jgi:O-antigen/teichoic acid export membrane protein
MVIFAEALATSVVAVFFVVALFTDAKLVGTLIALCVVIGGTAAFLFFVSRQLVYRKRWARSAAVFWQLIQIAIAWNSFTGEVLGYYFGVWLLVTAFVALYFLFNRRVVELTDEQIDRD